MKLFSVFIISILLLQAFAEASLVISNAEHSLTSVDESRDEVALHKKSHPRKINCSYACSRRCRKASRKNVCSRACKTCCKRCHCVPPGTYGNKNMCPCYASLKTHGHKPKCP
ncbi:hypothetical protein PVL29_024519 [Vitis rotundifolia]|uniref:Gibberellin-regulated protein 9 n=3 Tax=Vitis TaxID=3603 RepID=A0ABY9DTM9_VITVI|eukprot:XP_002272568.1 PREDICTED: gibberellin-regulated protein 9 [Vitis vinifera]